MLLPIFLIVLVDIFALTLVIPLLAIYAEHFGATPLAGDAAGVGVRGLPAGLGAACSAASPTASAASRCCWSARWARWSACW